MKTTRHDTSTTKSSFRAFHGVFGRLLTMITAYFM